MNALGQVDGKYESALTLMMKLADADSLPDLDQWQTVAQRVMSQIGDFDSDQFDKDLRNVLVEKAVGTVHTKVNNGLTKGGVFVYVDIYKHFTETSGLGLAAQALTSSNPTR